MLITAAEWLDVNYGRLVRELLLGALGGQAVHLVEPAVPVFADAAATSVITCFRPGTAPGAIRMRRVAGPAELGALAGGTPVPAAVLRATSRWGPLLRRPARAAQPGAAKPGRRPDQPAPDRPAANGRPVAGRRPGRLPRGPRRAG